jgi:hypothetical protein
MIYVLARLHEMQIVLYNSDMGGRAGKWINVRKNRRGNQEWAGQRHWQHEGAIKNGQARDTGNTKGQSRMGKPETLATLGTQDTRRRKTKHKKHTTKKMS